MTHVMTNIPRLLYQDGRTYMQMEKRLHFIAYSVAVDGEIVEYVIFKTGVDRNGTPYLGEKMKYDRIRNYEQFETIWRALTNDRTIENVRENKKRNF